MDSKLACQVPECEKKHTERLHDMLARLNTNVNLVTEEDEGEEEDGYVNVARGKQREENRGGWETLDDSWMEMEAAGRTRRRCSMLTSSLEKRMESSKTGAGKRRYRRELCVPRTGQFNGGRGGRYG
jgi:hypothetical protein